MPRTVDGTTAAAFSVGDRGLAVAVALIWGSSFLWTAIGFDRSIPQRSRSSASRWAQSHLGAYGPTRSPVDRAAWPGIVVVAIAGNAGPALLFAFAPVIAIILGATMRAARIQPAELVRTALILAGAYLISRRQRRTITRPTAPGRNSAGI